MITLLAAAASEVGLVRQNNEDAVYSGRWLFAVADGLGGHAAGELASAAVIESVRSHDAEADPAVLLQVLGQAVAEANRAVARSVAEDPARLGMGTTLTAALCSGNQAGLVHIGDSRAFRLRNGQLRQITEDHVMGKLVSNAGDLAPVMTRYLDGRPDRSPDLGYRELRPGDRYLLCSDGLSPIVADSALGEVLASAAGPGEAVRQLVALAEDAGGPDNISVIVIDVRRAAAEPGQPEPVTLGAARPRCSRVSASPPGDRPGPCGGLVALEHATCSTRSLGITYIVTSIGLAVLRRGAHTDDFQHGQRHRDLQEVGLVLGGHPRPVCLPPSEIGPCPAISSR